MILYHWYLMELCIFFIVKDMVNKWHINCIHMFEDAGSYVSHAQQLISLNMFLITYMHFILQIVQLTASGDFEEALALCKLLPPEDSSLRATKESSIHIR